MSKTRTRKGFASAMVIVSLLGVSCAGGVASVSRLTDTAFRQVRQEHARFLEERNLKEIGRIKKLSALSDEPWRERHEPRETREIIGEVIRQFPDFEEMRRFEEILYVSFLYYGFSEPEIEPFSGPEAEKAEKNFKEGIKALMKPYLKEWGKDTSAKPLVPVENVEKNERSDTGRWFFVPSLRSLIQSSFMEPLPEKIFRAVLFSEFYLGLGKEKSRASWEALRRLEMSNIGRDSLGMYQGGSIF